MKKITITPHKEAWQLYRFFFVLFCIIYPVAIGFIVFPTMKHDNWSFYEIVVMVALTITFQVFLSIAVVSMCIQNCKTYVFDEKGIIVKFWKYEKSYSWEEFKVKKIENNANTIFFRYTEGIVFSTKKVKGTAFLAMHERYSLIRLFTPFSSPFFVDFKEKNPKTRSRGNYRVEKTTFLADLSSIGVEVE